MKTEVLTLRHTVLGTNHPDTLHSMTSLATTFHEQGRYDEAERMKTEVLTLRHTVLGPISTHDQLPSRGSSIDRLPIHRVI
jgi:hypothetical protein